MLAMAERAIKANASEDQLQHHHRYLDALVNDGEISDDDPYYHWAERLYLELGDRLDGA